MASTVSNKCGVKTLPCTTPDVQYAAKVSVASVDPRTIINLLGLIILKIFFIDSLSDRPSKSMNWTDALMSNVCKNEMHLVGTSVISIEKN